LGFDEVVVLGIGYETIEFESLVGWDIEGRKVER
jgi:hypothetical protein